MRCIGRTVNFKRCKNHAKVIVCPNHKKQLLVLMLITIPTVLLTYFSFFQMFIRPMVVKEKIPKFLIKIEESVDKNDSYINDSYRIVQPERGWTDFYGSSDKVDSVLFDITNGYENGDEGKAILLIESYFNTIIKSHDKYLGYVVAAYFYSKRFELAAQTVLERNKYRTRWDYSLKLDYAKCIRYYTVSRTLNEGLDLVERHLSEYKSPIISYFWTAIPFEIMNNIEEGKHSLRTYLGESIRIEEINYLIKKYPYDEHISYGYYLTGNYAKSIDCNDNRILDVCLYAYGYDVVNKIFMKYKTNSEDNLYKFIPPKLIENKEDKVHIEEGIKALKQYVEDYEYKLHADDAAFWIAWLSTCIGKYDETYRCLLATQRIGNGDYCYISKNYLEFFNETVIVDKRTLNMALYNTIKEEKRYREEYLHSLEIDRICSFLDRLEYEEIIALCVQEDLYDFIYEYIYKAYNKGMTEKVINLYQFLKISDINFNFRIDSKYKLYVEYLIITKSHEIPFKNFTCYVLHVKNIEYNRRLALNLINIGVDRYRQDKDAVEYLEYLKIRTLAIYDPNKVKENVNDFLKAYPDCQYADDVLAELIQVELLVLNLPKQGFKDLKMLFSKYPSGNACDNALNILANYYQLYCSTYYGDWKENCRNGIDINNLIIRNFPESSYYDDAILRRRECMKKLIIESSTL